MTAEFDRIRKSIVILYCTYSRTHRDNLFLILQEYPQSISCIGAATIKYNWLKLHLKYDLYIDIGMRSNSSVLDEMHFSILWAWHNQCMLIRLLDIYLSKVFIIAFRPTGIIKILNRIHIACSVLICLRKTFHLLVLLGNTCDDYNRDVRSVGAICSVHKLLIDVWVCVTSRTQDKLKKQPQGTIVDYLYSI